MRPASLSVLAVLLLGCFVTAQSDQTQISDRVEVFGGYTYERPDFSLVNSNGGANGWNAAVNFKMRPWIGAVADFSGLYPRYTLPQLNGANSVPQAVAPIRICLGHRFLHHEEGSALWRTSWLGRATSRTRTSETRGAFKIFSPTMLLALPQAAALTTG
jgi:hypothetical protein